MPITSSAFNAAISAPNPILGRQLIIGGSDYSAFVTKWPRVRRVDDNPSPVSINLTLANHSGDFNFFREDRTKITTSADVYLRASGVSTYDASTYSGVWSNNMLAMADSTCPSSGLAVNATLNNSFWTVTTASFSTFSGAQLDPLGGNRAVYFKVGSHAGNNFRTISARALTTNSLDCFSDYQYNFSIYLKSGNESVKYAYLRANFEETIGLSGVSYSRVFDIESGTVEGHASGVNVASATIESLNNGWFRCSLGLRVRPFSETTAYSYSTFVGNLQWGMSDVSCGDPRFASTGSHSIFFAMPQLTLSNTPTTYTPTIGAAINPPLVSSPTKGSILFDIGGTVTSDTPTKLSAGSKTFGNIRANPSAITGSGGSFASLIVASSAENYGQLCDQFNAAAAAGGNDCMLLIDSGALWLQSCLSGFRSFMFVESTASSPDVLFNSINSGAVTRLFFAGGGTVDVNCHITYTTTIHGHGFYHVFGGRISKVRYHDNVIDLSITDKLKQLSERIVGTSREPVLYTGSNYLPSDIAWWAVTSFGGYSAVQSTSNPDIDYATFLEWAGVFSGDSIFVNARFEGIKVTSVLQKLQRMTDSAIFLRHNKLTFHRYSIVASEIMTVNDAVVEDVETEINDAEIVNRQYVFGDYNVSSEQFGITVLSQNASSVNSYGPREDVEKDESVWYITSATAQNFSDRLIAVRGEPFEWARTQSPLAMISYEIADMMSLTDASIELSDTFRVVEKEIDLDACKVRFVGRTNAVLNGFLLDSSLLDGDDVLT